MIEIILQDRLLLVLSACVGMLQTAEAAEDCEPDGDFAYVCGVMSAEDLVLVPGTRWLIASGFGGEASLYLVDTSEKRWQDYSPDQQLKVDHDKETFAACPGPVDPDGFVAHGLNIRAQEDDNSTLYIVGHGGREAIEVFNVDAAKGVPELTWIGCVLTPDGQAANSVASFADGSIVATIPLHAGFSIEDIFMGEPTGAAYRWMPGDAAMTKIDGTEMGYANGVEVSGDGSEFFVASSADWKIYAFSNTSPARRLRETGRLTFVPDNLHMGANGMLMTAGLETSDPDCGIIEMDSPFSLEEFASCHRGFTVLEIDPDTMATEVRADSKAQKRFSNITMAVDVGSELWIGTFAGDRIAYLPAH